MDYCVRRPSLRWALRLFDSVGAPLKRRRRLPRAREVQSILLIRPEHFGDLITFLPAVARARQLFPQARITLLLRPEYRDFVAAIPSGADKLWPLAVPWSSRGAPRRWGAFLSEFRRVWKQFDLAFDFLGDPRNLMLGALCSPVVAGYAIRGGGFLLGIAADYPASISASARQVRLIEDAYATLSREHSSASGQYPTLDAPAAWATAAVSLLRDVQRPYVIVHPGAGQTSKLWPHTHWCSVIENCRRAGREVVLTGSSADRALCDSIATTRPVRNLAGQTSLAALAGLVAEAECVLASDTGILHLAHLLGTRSVGLFGPNDPVVWGYETPTHRSLSHHLSCSYCGQGRCPRRSQRGACMTAITSVEVIHAWEQITWGSGRSKRLKNPCSLSSAQFFGFQ